MKRFTETEKWRDTWYRKLKPLSKLAFLYILDNCDSAGVWDPDYEFADFAIGADVNWIEVQQDFGERLVILKNGKWFLTRFIEFQYGELTEECRPHAKVLQLLKSHKIEYSKANRRVSIPTGSDRIRQDKTGQEQNPVTAEQIYEAYPRKEAKQDALKAIRKAMQHAPPDKILQATQTYASAVHRWEADDRKYIPHPATWFNGGRYDDDPKTWNRRNGQLNEPIVANI